MRSERLSNLCDDLGVWFNETDYVGGRYVIIRSSDNRGDFTEADTLEEVAEDIARDTDLLAYCGWYDLDDEPVHPHGIGVSITVVHGEETITAEHLIDDLVRYLWEKHGFEIPRELDPPAPPEVIREVWG